MSNYSANIRTEFFRGLKRNENPFANPSRFLHFAKITRYYVRTRKGGKFNPRKAKETRKEVSGYEVGITAADRNPKPIGNF